MLRMSCHCDAKIFDCEVTFVLNLAPNMPRVFTWQEEEEDVVVAEEEEEEEEKRDTPPSRLPP